MGIEIPRETVPVLGISLLILFVFVPLGVLFSLVEMFSKRPDTRNKYKKLIGNLFKTGLILVAISAIASVVWAVL